MKSKSSTDDMGFILFLVIVLAIAAFCCLPKFIRKKLAYKPRIPPKTCKTCRYHFGSFEINCALHPYGKEKCSDWEPHP